MNTRGEMARTFICGGRWRLVSFALWSSISRWKCSWYLWVRGWVKL